MDTVVEADFVADLGTAIRQNLTANRIVVPDAAAAFFLCVLHFNARWRRIPARPRRVWRSSELKRRTLPPLVAAMVDTVEEQARRGADLWPFLTRGILRAAERDSLLDNWRIHHLHVCGRGFRPDGFAERGDDLLYVYLGADDADDLLFIDVRSHGRWSDPEVLLIIDRNWPDVSEKWVLRGIPAGERPTEKEMAEAWKGGVTACFPAPDGRTWMPPGHGITANGWNVRVVDQARRLWLQAQERERWCRDHAADIVDAIVRQGGPRLARLRLRVRLHQGGFGIVEETINCPVNLM